MRFVYVKQYHLVWRIFYMWFILLLNMGQFLGPNHCCNFRTITLYLTQIHDECSFQNVSPMHSLLVAFKMQTPFFKKHYFVDFVFFSCPSTERKKFGEAKRAASVPITQLAGDAGRRQAECCKYIQIHHFLAWNVSSARADIRAPPAGAHHLSTCPEREQGCALGTGTLKCAHHVPAPR